MERAWFCRSKAAAANRFMDESFMFLPDEPIARRFSDNFGHENCVILCENSKRHFGLFGDNRSFPTHLRQNYAIISAFALDTRRLRVRCYRASPRKYN